MNLIKFMNNDKVFFPILLLIVILCNVWASFIVKKDVKSYETKDVEMIEYDELMRKE